jgi:hypothetical protein
MMSHLCPMTDTQIAQCSCGALSAACHGDPVRVSVCHCLNCKRRSGSAFSYTAGYDAAQVSTSGQHATYRKPGEEGRWADFHFCPSCGTTVFYEISARPGMISVPAGGFADPGFPEPQFEVFDERRADWCRIETVGPLTQQ